MYFPCANSAEEDEERKVCAAAATARGSIGCGASPRGSEAIELGVRGGYIFSGLVINID